MIRLRKISLTRESSVVGCFYEGWAASVQPSWWADSQKRAYIGKRWRHAQESAVVISAHAEGTKGFPWLGSKIKNWRDKLDLQLTLAIMKKNTQRWAPCLLLVEEGFAWITWGLKRRSSWLRRIDLGKNISSEHFVIPKMIKTDWKSFRRCLVRLSSQWDVVVNTCFLWQTRSWFPHLRMEGKYFTYQTRFWDTNHMSSSVWKWSTLVMKMYLQVWCRPGSGAWLDTTLFQKLGPEPGAGTLIYHVFQAASQV